MGCAILPYLKSLVEIIENGLKDDQQKVRTMTALSIAALAVPVSSYLNANIPLCTTLPLGSSFVIFSLYYSTFQNSQYAHGVSALSFASVPFLLYPLSSHVLQTSFY